MTVMVALLRGVNVSGKNRLAMADLRDIATGCGYADAQTYIQSGNLVFSTAEGDTAASSEVLRGAILERTGIDTPVVVRTRDELATAVADSPFLARGEDTAHLHLLFVDGKQDAVVGLSDLSAHAPEEAVAVGRDIHLLLPSGVGRSKLVIDLGRSKGPPGTLRNWRTVTKLLAMAQEVQPSAR